MRAALILPCLLLLLAGCEQVNQALGVEDSAKKDARLEAEGRAVGGGCRHSGRAIEDCYSIYGWLPKSAVFGGWRDMDAYMRENNIDTVAPQLPPPEPPGKKRKKAADSETTLPEKVGKTGEDKAKPAEAKAESKPEAVGDKSAGKPDSGEAAKPAGKSDKAEKAEEKPEKAEKATTRR